MWLRTQRKYCTDPERRKRLESLPGWSWKPKPEQEWQKRYELSLKYGKVPSKFFTPCGVNLGGWQYWQMGNQKDPEKIKLLQKIPGWGYKHEKAWKRAIGFCKKYGMVPAEFVTPCGFKLGRWQVSQRAKCKKPERRREIEEVMPDWYWEMTTEIKAEKGKIGWQTRCNKNKK